MCSPREIRHGEEIAWYADGETIVRNEHNPLIAYAYGKLCIEFIVFCGIICLLGVNLWCKTRLKKVTQCIKEMQLEFSRKFRFYKQESMLQVVLN